MAKVCGIREIRFVATVLETDEQITEPRKVVEYQDWVRKNADAFARQAVDNPTTENLERAKLAASCCYAPERPYLIKREVY